MTQRHADTPLAAVAATAKTSKQRTIDALTAASPSVLLLRDGELVLSCIAALAVCFTRAASTWQTASGKYVMAHAKLQGAQWRV